MIAFPTTRIALFTAALAAASGGSPASADDAAVRAAVSQAQAEMDRGEWEAAERRLAGERESCGTDAAGKSCRLLAEYSQGYLYERWGRSTPERRDILLRQSADAYRLVLGESPGHPATLNNLALVLRDLGETDALTSLLEQTRVAAPAQAADIALLIGDLHRDGKRWRDAFAAYLDAARLSPADEVPCRKAVEAYAQLPGADDRDLLSALNDWSTRFPGAAADGYRAIVVKHAAEDSSLYEDALLRWVDVASSQRFISRAKVDQDFAAVGSPAIDGLRNFLARLEGPAPDSFSTTSAINGFLDAGAPSADFAWWVETDRRRHALAQVGLASGRDAVVAQRPLDAQWRFLLGYRYAPDLERYLFGELRDLSLVPVDLLMELSWLQFRYHDLDPRGKKLDAFVERLFRGKFEAYEGNDLRAIQRFHTVLGEIYAAKGQWTGSWAYNAIFQLEHAIAVAEQRRQKEKVYEPLPGLMSLLAEGYVQSSRTVADAQKMYVKAAQGFLDIDDLPHAKRSLEQASKKAVNAQLRNRIAYLGRILATRLALASLPDTDPTPVLAGVDLGWLEQTAVPEIEGEFVKRQQFKTMADLATILARDPSSGRGAHWASSAVAAAKGLSTLLGNADLQRLERAAAQLDTGGTKGRPSIDVVRDASHAGSASATWRLVLPTADSAVYTIMSE